MHATAPHLVQGRQHFLDNVGQALLGCHGDQQVHSAHGDGLVLVVQAVKNQILEVGHWQERRCWSYWRGGREKGLVIIE